MTTLPSALIALLRRPSPCFIATVDPDGSPQLTETWVDTDGENILINTVAGFRKVRNIERDPRVSVIVTDPDNVTDYYSVKAHVVDVTAKNGAEHIEELAHKYLGGPYPWFGGRDQTRVIMTIVADKIVHAPLR